MARAFLALAAMGMSCAMALEGLSGNWLGAFVSGNVLASSQRQRLLLGLVGGAAVGVVVGLFFCLPRPTSAGVQRLSRAVRLLAPLGVVGLLPGVLAPDAWADTLALALSLSVFLALFEALCRLHFGAYASAPGAPSRARALIERLPPAVRRHGPAAIAAAAAVFFAAYMAFFTLRSHARFNTYTWDLGQIDNLFYNLLHGHPFRSTPLVRAGNWSELRGHAELVSVFLLPIYALHPAAETLLVLQSVLLGLGGVFLYRFAARRLSPAVALALVAAYYLYPPLHGPALFDIHFQPVAAAFILGAIDAFDARRTRAFVIFFILALTSREDVSLGLAMFGLFLILTGHRVRAGAVIVGVSMAYFIVLRFWIMPAAGSWGFAEMIYKQLLPSGEPAGFFGIFKTIVSNPLYTLRTFFTADKLRYILQILVPLAFLPARRLHLALSLLPGALFTLLSTGYPPTLDIAYQYGCVFVPYIFPAAALALEQMRAAPGASVSEAMSASATLPVSASEAVRRRAAVAAMLAGTILATTWWGAIPPRSHFRGAYGQRVAFEPLTPQERQRARDIRELAAMVPRAAVLAASDRELPHVSNRLECWNLSLGFAGADYILFGTLRPIPPDATQRDAAERAGYLRVAERPGLLLLKRPGAP
ncbi:MAG TPA: DUF2079 domain-containing protein [Polyangia bacterium]|nr:DUF2079 domain-containing protein [Polyangia bacterium]